MPIITGSFQYNGAKITVQKPNGFSRLKLWQWRGSLPDKPEGISWENASHLCYYLVNTVAVEGHLGFSVPCDNPTPDELVTFCRNLGEAADDLLMGWDATIQSLMAATNDPDLLPPAELDEKKSKPPKSE